MKFLEGVVHISSEQKQSIRLMVSVGYVCVCVFVCLCVLLKITSTICAGLLFVVLTLAEFSRSLHTLNVF